MNTYVLSQVYYWQVSVVSETLSGVYKFELVQYMYYICMDVCVS